MSNRFQPPSEEELASRGLAPDGTPLKKAAPKKPGRPKKDAPKEDS